MPRSRYTIKNTEAPYFLTATVHEWTPIFSLPSIAEIPLDSMRFLIINDRWTVHAYVLMGHHLHWIARSSDLTEVVRIFKSYTAHEILRRLKNESRHGLLKELKLLQKKKRSHRHRVWTPGTHPKEIQSTAMMRQKLEYIHNNPVKAGFVHDPRHWRYSSAIDYDGGKGIIPVQVWAPY